MGVSLADLRQQIRVLEGGSACRRVRHPSHVPPLDEHTGGLPIPGIVELSGRKGAGRSRLALAIAAQATQRARLVAWVDTEHHLYPPSARQHGLHLERLVIVRPPREQPSAWSWSTEQLLRSGCFSLVVAELPAKGHFKGRLQGWARAAEQGGTTLIAIASQRVHNLPAEIRLSVGRRAFRVAKNRGDLPGNKGPLPSLSEGACPWAPVECG